MASVLTVRVYRPDVPAESELARRLQTLAELELARLRDRTQGHSRAAIQSALGDGLARVTAGAVDVEDLPRAAAALERGDELAAMLITAPSATTAGH